MSKTTKVRKSRKSVAYPDAIVARTKDGGTITTPFTVARVVHVGETIQALTTLRMALPVGDERRRDKIQARIEKLAVKGADIASKIKV